jgi:hypothetical protein
MPAGFVLHEMHTGEPQCGRFAPPFHGNTDLDRHTDGVLPVVPLVDLADAGDATR